MMMPYMSVCSIAVNVSLLSFICVFVVEHILRKHIITVNISHV